MSDLVQRLKQIADHDWRVSFLAHTSDTASEAAAELTRLTAERDAAVAREKAMRNALAKLLHEMRGYGVDEGASRGTVKAMERAKAVILNKKVKLNQREVTRI